MLVTQISAVEEENEINVVRLGLGSSRCCCQRVRRHQTKVQQSASVARIRVGSSVLGELSRCDQFAALQHQVVQRWLGASFDLPEANAAGWLEPDSWSSAAQLSSRCKYPPQLR